MHEFSIVQSLLEVIEEEAKRHKAQRVLKVELLVGVLSGVEPHLLELAFNTFKEGTIAEKAELLLEIERLRLWCEDCKREYEKEELNLSFHLYLHAGGVVYNPAPKAQILSKPVDKGPKAHTLNGSLKLYP